MKCKNCGYCCKKAPCGYGKIGDKGYCKYLTNDNKCGIYKFIFEKESLCKYPMFWGGCDCALIHKFKNAFPEQKKEIYFS